MTNRCDNCFCSLVNGSRCNNCAEQIANATVKCTKCGKVPGEYPKRKYCGDGNDKDNPHNWKLITAKWIYEESSGYGGWRNTKTGEWIYEQEYQRRLAENDI